MVHEPRFVRLLTRIPSALFSVFCPPRHRRLCWFVWVLPVSVSYDDLFCLLLFLLCLVFILLCFCVSVRARQIPVTPLSARTFSSCAHTSPTSSRLHTRVIAAIAVCVEPHLLAGCFPFSTCLLRPFSVGLTCFLSFVCTRLPAFYIFQSTCLTRTRSAGPAPEFRQALAGQPFFCQFLVFELVFVGALLTFVFPLLSLCLSMHPCLLCFPRQPV